MIAVDTNVLLRYLMFPVDGRNPQWQGQAAVKIIDGAEKVYVSDIVIAEVEWVLESVFECTRQDIAKLVHALACNPRFVFDSWSAVQCAIMDYRQMDKVDFSDCLIARRAQEKGAPLYTFESKKRLGGHAAAIPLTKR